MKAFLIALILPVLLGGLVLVYGCGENDLTAKDPIKINGKVQRLDNQEPPELIPAQGVKVSFVRDPGQNPVDDRQTWTDSSGKYELEIYMDLNRCEPVRFYSPEYWEQDHFVCESSGNQSLSVTLDHAEDFVEQDCPEICDRFYKCEENFRAFYTDMDQCVEHCEEACEQHYRPCVFDFFNDKCVGLLDCFKENCDLTWLDPDKEIPLGD